VEKTKTIAKEKVEFVKKSLDEESVEIEGLGIMS